MSKKERKTKLNRLVLIAAAPMCALFVAPMCALFAAPMCALFAAFIYFGENYKKN